MTTALKKIIYMVLSILLLQIIPILCHAQDCNSDSLRILLRASYGVDETRDYRNEQADCFYNNIETPLDTIIYYLGRDWNSMALESIENNLKRNILDSNTIAELYYYKGYVLIQHFIIIRNDSIPRAVLCMDSCLMLNKDYDLAWYNKGIIHLTFGELNEAKECIERAVGINDRHMHYWFNYGIIQYHLDLKSESRESLDKVIKLSDKSFELYKKLGIQLVDEGCINESIRFLDSALIKGKTDADIWFKYGWALYKSDSTQNYSQYFDSSLKYIVDEKSIMSKCMRLSLIGHQKMTINFYDKLLSINISNSWAWFYKGMAYGELEEYNIAANCMDNAVKYDTSTSFRMFDILRFGGLVSYGLYDRAIQAFDDINLEEEEHEIKNGMLITKAKCYFELKRYLEAAKTLDKITPTAFEDSAYIKFRDTLYYELNKTQIDPINKNP